MAPARESGGTTARLAATPGGAAVPGLDSGVLADTLIGTSATHYRLEQPADLDELKRIGHLGGNALEVLVTAGAVPPGDVLRVGLSVLSVLARLCLQRFTIDS